jgi:hypothetical protein
MKGASQMIEGGKPEADRREGRANRPRKSLGELRDEKGSACHRYLSAMIF